MEIDEYALTKACKVYHDAKGQWADMTIRKCVEAYLEHANKHRDEPRTENATGSLWPINISTGSGGLPESSKGSSGSCARPVIISTQNTEEKL